MTGAQISPGLDPSATSIRACDTSVWRVVGAPLIPGARDRPLAGLRVAVKDLYAVAGHPIGAGNPTWLREAPSLDEARRRPHPAPGRGSRGRRDHPDRRAGLRAGRGRAATGPGLTPIGLSLLEAPGTDLDLIDVVSP